MKTELTELYILLTSYHSFVLLISLRPRNLSANRIEVASTCCLLQEFVYSGCHSSTLYSVANVLVFQPNLVVLDTRLWLVGKLTTLKCLYIPCSEPACFIFNYYDQENCNSQTLCRVLIFLCLHVYA